MAFTDEQVMLTLAGLTYRGFHDVLPGEPHDVIVSGALLDGLQSLQGMRARKPAPTASNTAASLVGRAVTALTRAGDAVRSRADATLAAPTSRFAAWLDSQTAKWRDSTTRESLKARLAGALAGPRVLPDNLRPRPASAGGAESDLLTFLAAEAAASAAPLDVTVTGHSKGAALAQAVALWLREALDAPAERWDAGRGARVGCHAFAGPTPGNGAFAARLDRVLGADHRHLRNRHDIVTHAWQVDELREIPALYGARTALFEPIITSIVKDLAPLDYRHARSGVRTVQGELDPHRGFALELAHQHMDAYLGATELHAHGIRALTFFF
jgi:hypothetical protein